MITLDYERTSGDWRAFVGAANRRAIGWPLLVALVFQFGGILLIMHLLSSDETGASVGIAVLSTAYLIYAVLIVYLRFYSGRNVREGGGVLGRRTIQLDAQGVEDKGVHNTIFYKWSGIKDVTHNKKLVTLWTDPAAGIFIPTRAFATEADRDAFVAFARQQITPKSG